MVQGWLFLTRFSSALLYIMPANSALAAKSHGDIVASKDQMIRELEEQLVARSEAHDLLLTQHGDLVAVHERSEQDVTRLRAEARNMSALEAYGQAMSRSKLGISTKRGSKTCIKKNIPRPLVRLALHSPSHVLYISYEIL
jgi:hypothetical protein